ncbi:MAG TPA: DUF5985 family protein [Nevskia sp.]|jgi:hypothetical protein|nr:DUF5985 family protein [Nevskia sp.]
MAAAVYLLGALTTLLCTVLLLRRYFHGRARLLMWSGLCFAGLTFTNALVFVDLVVLPEVDLYLWRLAAGIVAMALMIYGLVWEAE